MFCSITRREIFYSNQINGKWSFGVENVRQWISHEGSKLTFTDTVVISGYNRPMSFVTLPFYFAVISNLTEKYFSDFWKKRQKPKAQKTKTQQTPPNPPKIKGFSLFIFKPCPESFNPYVLLGVQFKALLFKYSKIWRKTEASFCEGLICPPEGSAALSKSHIFPLLFGREKRTSIRKKPGFQGASLQSAVVLLLLVLLWLLRIGKTHRNVPKFMFWMVLTNHWNHVWMKSLCWYFHNLVSPRLCNTQPMQLC